MPELQTLTEGERHAALLKEAGRIYAKLPREKARDARDALKFWYSRVCQPLKKNWEKECDDVASAIEQREYGSIISK